MRGAIHHEPRVVHQRINYHRGVVLDRGRRHADLLHGAEGVDGAADGRLRAEHLVDRLAHALHVGLHEAHGLGIAEDLLLQLDDAEGHGGHLEGDVEVLERSCWANLGRKKLQHIGMYQLT